MGGPGTEYYEDVFIPVESIFEGTWGSGDAPEEFYNFQLMEHFHWSWEELQATPIYVRAYCRDFLRLKWSAEERRNRD